MSDAVDEGTFAMVVSAVNQIVVGGLPIQFRLVRRERQDRGQLRAKYQVVVLVAVKERLDAESITDEAK
ncbi:hypothetical protein D3C85_1744980 [compost metagenome]